jgi:hypothetical protein
MPARRCPQCSANYPAYPAKSICPTCNVGLVYRNSESPDTDYPPEVKGSLGPESSEERHMIDRGWAWVDERKREGWSAADLIEAFPREQQV